MNGFRGVSVCVAGLAWLAVGVGCACAADGEEKPDKAKTVVIPLDQIWAYGMPGTRDVRDFLRLDREDLPQQPLGMRVGGPSSFISHEGKKIAGPGFAVLGTGMEAWLATHVKLPEGQKYPETFPFGSEISVVFFSHGFGQYIHIHRIEQQGNAITIRYRFVPHLTENFSDHFALIPVSGLQPGKVQVNIVRTSRKGKYIAGGWKPTSAEEERRVICKSFSFAIADPPSLDQRLDKDVVEIPLDQIWAVQMPGTRNVLSLDLEQLPQPFGMLLSGPQDDMKTVAGPGFAVLGTGMEALLATHAKLPEGQKPPDTFPLGSKLSVVFFSQGFGQYVHLHRVERQGNVITIRYRFVPHLTENFSDHFALIPVSGLQPGKVQVNIVRSPMGKEWGAGERQQVIAEQEHRVVCKSFSFSIEK